MPKVRFVEPGGEQREVDVASGESLMQAAADNLIKGIDGDCGGMCMCATCHIHVAPEWAVKIDGMGDEEEQMLSIAEGRNDQSRLACQITMSDELDGLVVKVAEHQH